MNKAYNRAYSSPFETQDNDPAHTLTVLYQEPEAIFADQLGSLYSERMLEVAAGTNDVGRQLFVERAGLQPCGVKQLLDPVRLSPQNHAPQTFEAKLTRSFMGLRQGVEHHIHRSNSSSVSLTQSLEEFWPRLPNLRWLHTGTVGMEHLLTPELIKSNVIVTNARGVYSHSLAEFAIMMCHFFAKGLPRFLAAKAEKRWDIFEVEELRGKTIGIIG
eukprot:gene2479-2783_t